MNSFLKHTWEWYSIPLIVSIFFLNYHYYKFYQSDYSKITQAVSPSIQQNNYELIQSYHPYYQIYLLAQKIKDPEKDIIFSDFELSLLNLESPHLKNSVMKKKDLARINRRTEDDFFVYQVIE